MSQDFSTQSRMVGGRVCLDFCNTVDWHASAHPQDRLAHYTDLVEWCRKAGLTDQDHALRLSQEAAHHPKSAGAALEKARTVREALYRIFAELAHEGKPAQADLDTLNDLLAEAMAQARVMRGQDGFDWSWARDIARLDALLWPIARSAAELLTSPDVKRVGQCADDRGCGWLFLDTSRNHSRRWCDIRDCGNRAKVRRHYERTRGH